MKQDEYLWDRSGEPAEEVVRLEKLMGQLRYQPMRKSPWRGLAWAGLLAAAAALILVLAWPRVSSESWKVGDEPLRAGQVVKSGRVVSDEVGSLEVEEGSSLRWEAGNRFRLDRGVVHALVWAPPRELVVETPAATAVDLGCQYTLRVDERGEGLLSVTTGWVALEAKGVEAFVPAGATCRTRKGQGPGLPYFGDASEKFRTAAAAWKDGDAVGLAVLTRESRERDAITLWHLVARTDGEMREAAVDRLGELVKIEDRTGLRRGDRQAIDAAWQALGLGGADWWRGWKQSIQP